MVKHNRDFSCGAATEFSLGREPQEFAEHAPDVYFRSEMSRSWHDDGLDIHQFLAELQSHGFAAKLTIDEINQQLMMFGPTPELPHAALISHSAQAIKALEKAGMRESVDVITDLETQFAVFSKMAGGEFDVDMIHVDEAAKRTLFRNRQLVFSYDVDRAGELQDPIVIAAIANAVLRHFKIENRFLTFDDFDGMTDINFFYGPPKLAKVLAEKYHVPFLAGSMRYFDSTKQ